MKSIIIVFSLFVVFSCFFLSQSASSSVSGSGFLISAGMSFEEIADKLKEENIVKSKSVFKVYGFITGGARQIKPGKYFFPQNISMVELFDALVKGPKEISVTIAPGLTLKEIDDKLSEARIINSGEIINLDINAYKNKRFYLSEADSLEGFLCPDTYRFFPGSDIDLVIHRFLENFEKKILPFFNNDDNILDKLILASILEKEIPDYEEKKVVAGILLKRLKIGMPLQVDASVIYSKCLGRFLNCPNLTRIDYKIDSDYNTYRYPGLPKGSISNPGLDSIKAILNPVKTNYWYYLSDPKTSKTIFSETFDEHNQNRTMYLLNN